MRTIGLFLCIGGPFRGCPYDKPSCLGSIFGPLIVGNSQISSRAVESRRKVSTAGSGIARFRIRLWPHKYTHYDPLFSIEL